MSDCSGFCFWLLPTICSVCSVWPLQPRPLVKGLFHRLSLPNSVPKSVKTGVRGDDSRYAEQNIAWPSHTP
jgi:hypothetical protein